METRLSETQAQDELVIRTANSEYRFCITDPNERRGRLTGGTLGDSEREAVLAGTLSGSGNLKHIGDGLTTGGRAVFYVAARNGVERLITSVITRLRHERYQEESSGRDGQHGLG
jgi:hypothetical protein